MGAVVVTMTVAVRMSLMVRLVGSALGVTATVEGEGRRRRWRCGLEAQPRQHSERTVQTGW